MTATFLNPSEGIRRLALLAAFLAGTLAAVSLFLDLYPSIRRHHREYRQYQALMGSAPLLSDDGLNVRVFTRDGETRGEFWKGYTSPPFYGRLSLVFVVVFAGAASAAWFAVLLIAWVVEGFRLTLPPPAPPPGRTP